MPKQSTELNCQCDDCMACYGAQGKTWASTHERRAHLNCVRLESDFIIKQEEACLASACLFALTLMDEGPYLDTQPPRHWTSPSDFQDSRRDSDTTPAHSTSLPIEGIVTSVCHLSSQQHPELPTKPFVPHHSTIDNIGSLTINRSTSGIEVNSTSSPLTLPQVPSICSPPQRHDLPAGDQN